MVAKHEISGGAEGPHIRLQAALITFASYVVATTASAGTGISAWSTLGADLDPAWRCVGSLALGISSACVTGLVVHSQLRRVLS